MKSRSNRFNVRLGVNSLERRDVPAGWFATGADAGGGPHVIIRTDTNNDGKLDTIASSFYAFNPSFHGGVRVAVGNVDNDPNKELVTVAGQGDAALVRIWDVSNFGHVVGLQEEFYAFDPAFRGGAYVAVGAMFGAQFFPTSRDQVVLAAGEGGGPHVKIFRDTDGDGYVSDNLVDEFFAFEAGFRGGVRVAVGRFYSGTPHGGPTELVAQYISNFDYLIVAAGPGGGPHVKVYNSFGEFDINNKISDNGLIDQFFAFDPGYRGGVFVGATELNSDDSEELLVTGAGTVDIYSMAVTQSSNGTLPGVTRYGVPARMAHSKLHSFQLKPGFTGDIHVSAVDFRFANTQRDLVTSFGAGADSSVVFWAGDSNNGNVSSQPRADEFFAFADGNGQSYGVGVWTAFSGNIFEVY